MDFIYSRLNNNLVEINRIEAIFLLKCEVDDDPIEGLKIGDYYLKVTVIDSDRPVYCDLSDLNKDEQSILDKIYVEQARAINRENLIEYNSGNHLDISQDEQTGIVTINLLNIHDDILDTKTIDLETEKIIRTITLDQQNELLVFTLVDGTTINCDISDLIDDYDNKILILSNHVTTEVNRLDNKVDAEEIRAKAVEEGLTTSLQGEITRATTIEQGLRSDLTTEITNRQTTDSGLSDRITVLETLVDSGIYEPMAGLVYEELE